MSDEVLLAQIEVQHTYARAVVAFGWMAGFALVVWASSWPAHELAGRNTSVLVSVTFQIAVTAAGLAALARLFFQRKHIKDLRGRNARLSERVRVLEKQLAERSEKSAVRAITE